MTLSAIICTYNPEESILSKCLMTVAEAAKQCADLEILIVDNNSSNAFSEREYFKAFMQLNKARLVVEKKQGLTPARLTGIKKAIGDVLVFIDDDNFVAADFFEKGLQVATRYPFIGAWSGRVALEYEKEPEVWALPYLGLLVKREITDNKWSNLPHLSETTPCGAGLFVRKAVAAHYLSLHEAGKRDIQLDRNGKSLFSGGDNDLAACACDIGMGMGIFHEIQMRHFIPAGRLKKNYLLNLAEGIAASSIVFYSFRGEMPAPLTLKKKIATKLRWLLKSPTEKQFYAAVLRGEKKGRILLTGTK